MRRIGVGLAAVVFLAGVTAFSGAFKAPEKAADFAIVMEGRNPWSHLRLNNQPGEFQFAIVSDRTGGHRAKVFSRAVERLNLLQPEFVVSVGDLIEGYTEDPAKMELEWREFQGYIGRLQMPFFYVPGNHDLSNPRMEELWKEKFGRRWYHFVKNGVLFLMLSSEDPPGLNSGHISAEQIKYVQQTLADNAGCRWTMVFLHKPLWTASPVEKTGWLEVEKALTGRPYTVFAGHVHRYQRFLRNGQRYYQLATTGGVSKMRGTRYGEFDHIVWVTMKSDGPVLANVLLDGVLPEDLRTPETEEEGTVITHRQPTQPVRGKVYFEGTPVPQAYVVFLGDPKEKRRVRADAITEADGSFVLSTYTANDGAPAGDYAVTVVWRRPLYTDSGQPGPNFLPDRYSRPETSGLKATVKSGTNDILLELKQD